ncbi:MAG: MATE family efflux transporter [Bacteroidales bacterium]|nr:MATE family efflux transporter [Bacteroidales bacterium]MCI7652678.1 MATE family efflux transporter [Bacteroidales bacterium]
MDNLQATLELGTKPIGRLLWQYALPAIVAMLASSLYNMVDSIFIGQGVGPIAISGLAITFPFMNLTGAFGAAIGVGSSTYLSVKLGQKDYRTAERILGNTLMLNVYVGVALSVVCLLMLDPILRFFGASDATLPYARQYMVIILAGNVVTHTYLGLNAVLRAASKPRQAMNATIFTVVFNTILDPIFIYPWGLGLGISGAAYATILAQILALCYQARLLGDKRQLIHFSRGTYKLQSQIIKNIIAIGVSPFAMNVCSCIIVIFINNQLVSYGGDLAVGAYGISNKILFVFTMFVLGLNQGMQPIAGYNFGAQRFDRLMRVVKLTMLSATAVVTVGWCFAMFLPQLCVRLFTTDATLIGIAANALRISGCMFPIVGYQMVTTNFFQCIGKVKVSIFLSLSRQLIFLLPMLWLLPHFFQLNGVWFSMPTSDLLASIVTAWVMVRYMRMFKRQQQEKDGAA